MTMTFPGYLRPCGRYGIRNQVAIISAMDNTNPSAERIGDMVRGTTVLATPFGRGQIGADMEVTRQTLANLALHPNVAAALVLSLSLETAEAIASRLRPSGKPVAALGLQETGSALDLTLKGARLAAGMVLEASAQTRVDAPASALTVGVECGGSDATSGLASNPATGRFADRLVDAGGTIVLSEPAEFMGAEHLLAARAERKEDAARIVEMVKWFEDEAMKNGVDMRGTNPTPDNIAGGLTTLEEKSLGAIAKGGTRPVVEVTEYGETASRSGLVVMNTPSAACESMTGLAAGGCQAILFSTGRGNAIGAPIAPTLKITGNPHTAASMGDNIDVDVSGVLSEGEDLDQAGGRIWDRVFAVAGGMMTTAEVLGEEQLAVSRFSPSV